MRPALTLHQPWASLIAEGIKTIETRSWKAPDKLIGQTIGIHAAARKPDNGFVGDYLITNGEIGPKRVPWGDRGRPLPLGVIVATARLAACVPMISGSTEDNWVEACVVIDAGGVFVYDDLLANGRDLSDQLPYGDFAPGRWAWILDDIASTTSRCPWCMGTGDDPSSWEDPGTGEPPRPTHGCVACTPSPRGYFPDRGIGSCDPVPAKGRQRLWYWTPEDGAQ